MQNVMQNYEIKRKIIDTAKKAKSVSIFANISSSTLYDPIQNFSVTIRQDYTLDKDGWGEVKAVLKRDLGATKFRKIGNTLCMYIKEDN